MKKTVNFIASVTALVCSCAGPKVYTSPTDWDVDKNGSIQRHEFVDAYVAQNYFDKWSGGKSSASFQDLYNSLFDSMDGDNDQKLSPSEFDAQIKLFYFGMFSNSFNTWDDDSNGSVSQSEFNQHVSASNLSSLWDNNGDKRISEKEMAGGMFYLCDTDSDGSVSHAELEIWKKNR